MVEFSVLLGVGSPCGAMPMRFFLAAPAGQITRLPKHERRHGDHEEDEEADPRQAREIASQTAEAEHGGDNCNQKECNGPVERDGDALSCV